MPLSENEYVDLKLQIQSLEEKKQRLHRYAIDKLDDEDYHGVADAAMDLRELAVELKIKKEMIK